MQTLGISNSPIRTEGRLKSLFWPSVETSNDVDYLGAQGYWVCAIIAVLSFVVLAFTGHIVAAAFTLVFFYFGGVGVRQRSRYAAAVVLIMYVTNAVASRQASIIVVLVTGLLLANLRATWIAARWKPDSDAAVPPPRFSETWSDKFTDQLPIWLWPKVRILYYAFSGCFLILLALGIAILHQRHT